ncbi:unnamed protein product [Ambrosiozyma monospora]|uniref:Unnamed protein product n=1 Tax=Ambrosiozyma monospora TaxID=43982 RepID=A0ACB5TCB8_AMBMO|nr:unnamed protein product [Ambrosiozyma monospora]
MKLAAVPKSKTIVFFSCADSVDYHFKALTREGKTVSVIAKKEDKTEKSETERGTEKDKDSNNNGEENDWRKRRELIKAGKTVKPVEPEIITASTAPLLHTETTIYRLHGSLTQHVRTSTLGAFSKSEDSSVLFCTDVASRGLDLLNIGNVVEFDPPFTIDDHLHRVGRTARSGSKGDAFLFLLPGIEENYVGKIESFHAENSIHFINFENILKDAFGKKDDESEKRKSGKKEDNWDIHATTFQLNLERYLLVHEDMKENASNAFISHIRAYTTHLSSERDCFSLKAVHMGHLAKSFGLRETPKKVAGFGAAKNAAGNTKKTESGKSKMLRMAKLAVSSANSEFNTF